MTVVTNYPREIVYVMSCQELNSGHLLFMGLDDFSKLIFPLGMFENVSDETYEKAIYALLDDKNFKDGKGKFKLVVGFGEAVCRKLSPRITSMGGEIVYDPDLAINSSWEYVKKAFAGNVMFNLKPVSLSIKKIETWVNFLNREFINRALPIPKEFSSASKELLADFKNQFVSGVEHVAFVDINSTKRIMSLSQSEIEKLLVELHEIPQHNGIIYMDVGNGFTSDFIYRLTHFDEGVNIVCFRQESEKIGLTAVTICFFKKGGGLVLHSPSGMGDAYNAAKLISIVMRPKHGLNDISVNYNKELIGMKSTKADLIPVAKYLYVGKKGE